MSTTGLFGDWETTEIGFLESLLIASRECDTLCTLNGKHLDFIQDNFSNKWFIWYDNKRKNKQFDTRREAAQWALDNLKI
jgi:hypothetical protein